MVLCYNEKDRLGIESLGMKIIEFKRMMYKLSGMIQKVFQTVRGCVDAVRKIFQSIIIIEPQKRWKLVRFLIKADIPHDMFFQRWRIYHCRNNC